MFEQPFYPIQGMELHKLAFSVAEVEEFGAVFALNIKRYILF
jgi:hypothetical protein